MSIAKFLLARIAEDEAAARPYATGRFHQEPGECDQCAAITESENWRGTPDRVLAECEAKRRRVKVLNERAPHPNAVPLVRKLLALEALPYADHLDYRKEWVL